MYTTRQAAGLHAQHSIGVQACQMWYTVKLHRPSIKGIKPLLKVIKTIIINIHSNARTPVHAGLSQQPRNSRQLSLTRYHAVPSRQASSPTPARDDSCGTMKDCDCSPSLKPFALSHVFTLAPSIQQWSWCLLSRNEPARILKTFASQG